MTLIIFLFSWTQAGACFLKGQACCRMIDPCCPLLIYRWLSRGEDIWQNNRPPPISNPVTAHLRRSVGGSWPPKFCYNLGKIYFATQRNFVIQRNILSTCYRNRTGILTNIFWTFLWVETSWQDIMDRIGEVILWSSYNWMIITQYFPSFPSITGWIFPSISHFFSLFPIISQHFPLFPIISQYFPFFPIISHFPPSFPNISQYFPLFPSVSHCFPLFPIISH